MTINVTKEIHFLLLMLLSRNMHAKCRGGNYPLSKIKRLGVPDCLVPWFVEYKDYNPPVYESKILANKPWADPPIDDPNFNPKWNELDGKVNRKSHMGDYEIKNGRPLNPKGRTGLIGRGILGKWGPNHAADPIVTRWKVDEEKTRSLNPETNKPILQFCAIQRKDCGQWALPGGMVDPGENVNETLKREFLEEVLNSLETSEDQRRKDKEMVRTFFTNGIVIFKGYVDDPRNSDNAWIETVAVNFHDDDGQHVGKFDLKAGDDAANVRWMELDKNLDLYASHSDFLRVVAERLEAHW